MVNNQIVYCITWSTPKDFTISLGQHLNIWLFSHGQHWNTYFITCKYWNKCSFVCWSSEMVAVFLLVNWNGCCFVCWSSEMVPVLFCWSSEMHVFFSVGQVKWLQFFCWSSEIDVVFFVGPVKCMCFYLLVKWNGCSIFVGQLK